MFSALRQTAVFAVAATVLWLHAAHYLPFIADDALISLRYAQRLIDGHGLTWTDGSPAVEGYSNLLWVLLNAGLGALGMDLVNACRLLGMLSSLLTVGAVLAAARVPSSQRVLPALTGTLTVALAGPIAAWSIGGLEQPLVACLLAWGFVHVIALINAPSATWRDALWPSICFALLVLTRPDAPLWVATVAGMLWLCRGPRQRASLRVAATFALLPFATYLGQLAFRLAYYGEWIPNTARVKVAFTSRRLEEGVEYVAVGLSSLLPIAAIALLSALALLWSRERRRPALLLFVPTVAWLAYVIVIGGDYFAARRHLVPVVVPMAMLAVLGVDAAASRWRSATARGLLWATVLLLLAVYTSRQLTDAENQRAGVKRWEWDGRTLALALKRGFAPAQPLLAVTAAGCMPFWTGFPAIDMLGLNDHFIARHPPKNFGSGKLGHELGDGAYVLDRNPDLIVYTHGLESERYRAGRQLKAMPEYQRRYQRLWFRALDPDLGDWYVGAVFVNRQSDTVGIRTDPNRVEIPAHFFGHAKTTPTQLDREGRFFTRLRPGQVATIRGISLTPGEWRVDAGTTSALVIVRGQGQRRRFLPGEPTEFTVTEPARFALRLRARDEPAILRQVALVRER
ncbi:MAG: hypothetical protein AAF628_24975 [Planctomycetota bacterium]